MLCTENAKIAINYLAFLVSLPAWSAQNEYKNLAALLGDLNYEETANDMITTTQTYASYGAYAEAAKALDLV